MHRRSLSPALALGVAMGMAAVVPAGRAQGTWPAKPVRMVIGFAPGGSTDVAARLVAKKMSDNLGQVVMVENRAGASSNIAAQLVARSPADGYTLLYMTSTLTVNVSLFSKLPFNLQDDFAPVTPVVDIPLVLSVHPSIPARSVKELIALAKSQPGKISYASAGSGSGTHLATELFKTMTGTDLLHVPYQGSGPATNDFIGGHVQVMFAVVGQVEEHGKTGRMRPLAVSSRQRLPNLPDLPTLAEAGVPQFEATVWNGILAPAGTPRDIVARVNRETAQAVKELNKPLVDTGAYPMYANPEQFAAFVKSEVGKWADVVKRSGAKAE